MKNVLFMIALSLSGTTAFANFMTVGASNVSACAVSGGMPRALVEAENQAKKAADESCLISGNMNSTKLGIKLLFQQRGSCWAGANSSVVVVYYYQCRDF